MVAVAVGGGGGRWEVRWRWRRVVGRRTTLLCCYGHVLCWCVVCGFEVAYLRPVLGRPERGLLPLVDGRGLLNGDISSPVELESSGVVDSVCQAKCGKRKRMVKLVRISALFSAFANFAQAVLPPRPCGCGMHSGMGDVCLGGGLGGWLCSPIGVPAVADCEPAAAGELLTEPAGAHHVCALQVVDGEGW